MRHRPDGEIGGHARRQDAAPVALPKARAASRVTPATASSTVRPNRMQAMLAISRSGAKGEVPGLRSVGTAIGTPGPPQSRHRRDLPLAQEIEGARQQHGGGA